MILQIRTKDNLEDLLRHGNSPSWVVSEGKVNDIEKVEIYQFDGKRVLKADFDKSLSSRTESGRLIVAFSNGTIEECEHKWIGQNPIKYVRDNEVIVEIVENSNLFNPNVKPHLITFNDGTINDVDTFIDFVVVKIESAYNFIKEKIDDKLKGFILLDFDHFGYFKLLTNFISIDNKELRSLIKNQVNLDIEKKGLSVEDLIVNLVLIFDPKESELAIWKEEFLELSEILDLSITIFGYSYEYGDIVYQQYDCGNWEEGIVACDQGYMEDSLMESYEHSQNPDDFPDKLYFNLETYESKVNTTLTMETNHLKVGFYAGKNNDDDNNEECCNAGDQPDYVLLGGFKDNNGKKEFVGRVITNWCDKYPTDSLIYNGKSVIDSGGFAEDEDGSDLWDLASNEFPNLLNEINALYDYLEIDQDDEHYNLSMEIPDEIRLYNLYEGEYINLQEVKKGNGENLGIDFWL